MPSNNAVSTMDFLSAIFFIVAGVWLFAAIVYSLMVFYFLRLRSLNLLHTIHDEEFGRCYIFPKCCRRANNQPSNDDTTTTEQSQLPLRQYYLSFGWMFRRYARHLNIDSGSDRDESRRYKRSERREAVRVLLQQHQLQHQRKAQCNSKKQQQQLVLSSPINNDTPQVCCRGNDGGGNLFRRATAALKFQRCKPENVLDARKESSDVTVVQQQQQHQQKAENQSSDESDLSHLENGVAMATKVCDGHNSYNHTTSLAMDEVLICSICLGEYDDDNNDDDDDDLCDDGRRGSGTRHLDTPRPTATRTTTGTTSTTFQSSTCVHQFHMECILNWLQRKTNIECPCCRIPMIDDKDVWKTILQLRKQKRRSLQKLRHQQLRSKKQTAYNQHHDDDNRVDETANSETDHEGA